MLTPGQFQMHCTIKGGPNLQHTISSCISGDLNNLALHFGNYFCSLSGVKLYQKLRSSNKHFLGSSKGMEAALEDEKLINRESPTSPALLHDSKIERHLQGQIGH